MRIRAHDSTAPVPKAAPVSANPSSAARPAPSTYAEVASEVESVTGWLAPGQDKLLFDIARSLPDDAVILEMGAALGRSTCALAFACLGTNKRIYTIDTWIGNDGSMNGLFDQFGLPTKDPMDAWKGNLKRCGLEGAAIPLRGLTHEVLSGWDGYPMVDFVFIDASHEYHDVSKDFEMIFPFVKEGGWIAFHDVEPGWAGSWRAWLGHAKPVLTDHRYASSLAAGRKTSAARKPVKETFSFAAHWVEELVRAEPCPASLVEAMRTSLRCDLSTPDRERLVEEAEDLISRMPPDQKKVLEWMVVMDGNCDGTLWLWWALALRRDGHAAEASAALSEAARVSFAAPAPRIAHYRAVWEASQAGSPAAPRKPFTVKKYELKEPERFDALERRKARHQDRNLPWLQSRIRPSDKVIELGSGNGTFLKRLECASKIGIEESLSDRKVALLNHGIESQEDAAFIPGDWADVLFSNHGLEDCSSPLGALRSLHRVLRPGGKALFAICPSSASLFSWSPVTAANLLSKAGFRILETESVAVPAEAAGVAGETEMRFVAERPTQD